MGGRCARFRSLYLLDELVVDFPAVTHQSHPQHSGQRENMLIPQTSDSQSLLRRCRHIFANLGLNRCWLKLSKGLAQSVQEPLFAGCDEQLVESNLTG